MSYDLTTGTALAGDQEVVCHNDLSPKNTVYAEDASRAIAFIDWDIAAPGARIHDIAFICWQYADLGDLDRVIPQWQALLSGYGPTDLTALIPTILWWQSRAAEGIESEAAAGDPAKQNLVALRVPDSIRQAHTWIESYTKELQQALNHPPHL